jgi:hypothetical protein
MSRSPLQKALGVPRSEEIDIPVLIQIDKEFLEFAA